MTFGIKKNLQCFLKFRKALQIFQQGGAEPYKRSSTLHLFIIWIGAKSVVAFLPLKESKVYKQNNVYNRYQ